MSQAGAERRLASFSDFPPGCIVRIAAKLDLAGDILALRASCARARESLGLAGWMLLLERKSVELSELRLLHERMERLGFLSTTRPEPVQKTQHLHLLMRQYDAQNNPTLTAADYTEWFHPDTELQLRGSFKGVTPGVYHVCADLGVFSFPSVLMRLQLLNCSYKVDTWKDGRHDGKMYDEACILEWEDSEGELWSTDELRVTTGSDIKVVLEFDDLMYSTRGSASIASEIRVKLRKVAALWHYQAPKASKMARIESVSDLFISESAFSLEGDALIGLEAESFESDSVSTLEDYC